MKKEYANFAIDGNRIIIKNHVKQAKPITGTKIGAITNDNPWSTPFVAFMDMYRFSPPFVLTKQIQKGVEYEPIVIKTVNMVHNTNFKDYSNQSYYDFPLSGETKKYNGKIDGWDDDKKIVLECKVTSLVNMSKWIKNHPPKSYLLQMLLYGKLAGASEVWLAGYFLKEDEYDKFAQEKLSLNRLKIWKYKVNEKAEVFFEKKLNITKDFFAKHIDTRISPEFNIAKQCDRELLEKHKIEF